MSTRYIWEKYTFTWGLGEYQDVYTAPWNYFSSYPDPTSGYTISENGKYHISSGSGGSLTMSILTGQNTPASNWYAKYLVGGTGDYLAEQLVSGTFWCRAGSTYVSQGSGSGDVVNGNPNETVSSISGNPFARTRFRLYGPPVSKRGSSIGHVTSANTNQYPSNGASGGYYYTKNFTDNPDPQSITTTIQKGEPGQSIRLTIPINSNVFANYYNKPEVIYTIKRKIDNGNWQIIGTTPVKVVSSKFVDPFFDTTIPENASTVQYAVSASDGAGWQTTSDVVGSVITIESFRGYFYDASGVARKVDKGYFYDTSGVARKIEKGYYFDSSGIARRIG